MAAGLGAVLAHTLTGPGRPSLMVEGAWAQCLWPLRVVRVRVPQTICRAHVGSPLLCRPPAWGVLHAQSVLSFWSDMLGPGTGGEAGDVRQGPQYCQGGTRSLVVRRTRILRGDMRTVHLDGHSWGCQRLSRPATRVMDRGMFLGEREELAWQGSPRSIWSGCERDRETGRETGRQGKVLLRRPLVQLDRVHRGHPKSQLTGLQDVLTGPHTEWLLILVLVLRATRADSWSGQIHASDTAALIVGYH